MSGGGGPPPVPGSSDGLSSNVGTHPSEDTPALFDSDVMIRTFHLKIKWSYIAMTKWFVSGPYKWFIFVTSGWIFLI